MVWLPLTWDRMGKGRSSSSSSSSSTAAAPPTAAAEEEEAPRRPTLSRLHNNFENLDFQPFEIIGWASNTRPWALYAGPRAGIVILLRQNELLPLDATTILTTAEILQAIAGTKEGEGVRRGRWARGGDSLWVIAGEEEEEVVVLALMEEDEEEEMSNEWEEAKPTAAEEQPRQAMFHPTPPLLRYYQLHLQGCVCLKHNSECLPPYPLHRFRPPAVLQSSSSSPSPSLLLPEEARDGFQPLVLFPFPPPQPRRTPRESLRPCDSGAPTVSVQGERLRIEKRKRDSRRLGREEMRPGVVIRVQV